MGDLSELERRVLTFERQWWARPGAKEHAILAEFGHSPTRHAQIVNRLLDTPAALAADPVTVNRLRRLRDARTRRMGA